MNKDERIMGHIFGCAKVLIGLLRVKDLSDFVHGFGISGKIAFRSAVGGRARDKLTVGTRARSSR